MLQPRLIHDIGAHQGDDTRTVEWQSKILS